MKGPLNLDSLCHTSCVMAHFIILMNQPHKMRMRSHSFLNYICFRGHVSFFFLFLVTVQRRGIFWFDIWMGRKRFCVGRYQLRWIWTDRRIWAGFGWIEGRAAALVIVLTPATTITITKTHPLLSVQMYILLHC